VAVIHQELSLIGPMSVADNIFLGRTPTRAGFVQDAKQHAAAQHWVRQLGLELDVSQPVERFPVATRQLIEIAKALSQNARVIVMDEPTSALNAPGSQHTFCAHPIPQAARLLPHLHHPQNGGNRAHRRPRHRVARRPMGRHGVRGGIAARPN
jgi:ABC-type cobalamin/Fe3+-siderophores transport system ATPase subunit